MTSLVNIADAEAHLSELVTRTSRGEEIILARAGRPVAKLVAITEPTPREFGRHPELAIPADVLLAPLDADELEDWEA